MEGTLMPVFLQKLLLTLWLLFPEFLSTFQIFFHTLLFWHSSSAFDFFALFLARQFLFLLLLYPSEFAQSPCLEFSRWVQSIRIIDIWNFVFFFLCKLPKSTCISGE
jgi:hypothetical protein